MQPDERIEFMNIFDIIGPVMVGPSSSHTAGAVRIGYISGKLLGEPVKEAQILLYGSFLATGKGHGTQKALVAGLLGMAPDDIRIPDSMELAAKKRIAISFGVAQLREAPPELRTDLSYRGNGKDVRGHRRVDWRRQNQHCTD